MAGFRVTIIIMLFYSVAITMLSYAMPTDARVYVTGFSDITSSVDIEQVGQQVQTSVTRQTNIPVIEVGALVFYSGNILVDLLLNFAYAIPQMVGMLVHSIAILFSVDTYIWAVLQIFASVLVTVLYFIGLIQLITGIRSGRLV